MESYNEAGAGQRAALPMYERCINAINACIIEKYGVESEHLHCGRQPFSFDDFAKMAV